MLILSEYIIVGEDEMSDVLSHQCPKVLRSGDVSELVETF